MRSNILSVLVLVATCCAGAPAQADAVPPALTPYITADEYRAAGLHRLSPSELEAFERWFLRAVGAFDAERERLEAAVAQPDTENPALFGFGAMAERTPEVSASLDGTFTGWSRGTRIRLENGQVWEVVEGATFRPVRPVERPAVTVRRAAFGSFLLRVDGYNASVRVRRIE